MTARKHGLNGYYDPVALKELTDVVEDIWASLTPSGCSQLVYNPGERQRLAAIVWSLGHDRHLTPRDIAITARRLMTERNKAAA